ncbi:MAG: phosphatase, partial [Betaproteobacteria bacterium]|nr:phosphatase [Betaproteobacteria bacterium]
MIKQKILTTLVSGAIFMMTGASQTIAASTGFNNFTALPNSVAGGSLPESSPFLLANPSWTQLSIANRSNQLAQGQTNSGNWDMIAANETEVNAGRYLFMPFEIGNTGVQRIDL